jgi:hypothetical protein
MQEESEDDIESGQEDIRETKRPCRKDEVVVVVDGREFVEGIQRLRESSGYFTVQPPSSDRRYYIRSSQYGKEWELVSELFRPLPTKQITRKDVPAVLWWFEYLDVPRGFQHCDCFLAGLVPKMTTPSHQDTHRDMKHLHEVIEILQDISLYKSRMPQTTDLCFRYVRCLTEFQDGLYVRMDHVIKTIWPLGVDFAVYRQEVLDALKGFIPSTISVDKRLGMFDDELSVKLAVELMLQAVLLRQKVRRSGPMFAVVSQ